MLMKTLVYPHARISADAANNLIEFSNTWASTIPSRLLVSACNSEELSELDGRTGTSRAQACAVFAMDM